MNTQLLIMALGLMAVLVLGYVALAGPSPARESQRRLQALRFRHSDSANDKVEAQYRKAVAARKPKVHQIAGSGSRVEALALRLHRTGKGWSMQQYLYASVGLALAIAVLMFLKSGAALLSLGFGIFVGAGLPHLVVGHFVKKRGNQFTDSPLHSALFARQVFGKGAVGDAEGIQTLERNGRIAEGARHLFINLGDHEAR